MRNQLTIIGVLFNSCIFQHRVFDEDVISLTCMIRDDSENKEILCKSDLEITNLIVDDLRTIFGEVHNPLETKITRWEKGFPLYSPDLYESWFEMDQILKRRSCRFCNIKLGTKNADQECPHPRNGCVDWAKGIRAFWDISEIGAHDALEYFLENGIHEFDTREKHRADRRGTSMISPYMRFGQISARQVLHEIQVKFNSKTISKS